jgi:uncharacterized protein (TIGR02996 family)
MDHPDWLAFIAAIVANPDDDTARLVAADFLEEHGDAHRAEFIRIQVQLASLETNGQDKTPAAELLRARVRTFLGPLSVDPAMWAATECPELVSFGYRSGHNSLEDVRIEGAERVTFRRGFIEDVRCSALDWLKHGGSVRQRLPILHVALGTCNEIVRDQWYEMLPALRGLRVVALQLAEVETARWLEMKLPGTHVGIG